MSAPWLRNNTASNATSGAASVWTEHVANDNRVYYWNSDTKTSSWEKPDVLKTAEERAKSLAVPESADDWKEYETPDGKKYYHNAITNVTTWDKPEILAQAEAQAQIKQRERSRISEGLEDHCHHGEIDNDEKMQELERTDRINMVGRDGKAITAAMYAVSDEAIPVFKTVEQAEEAFSKMLRKLGVQADWSWLQTMKIAIVDPVWRALSDTAARKETFERYLVEVKKATIGKQKDRIEKLKRNFDLMLRRHDEIEPYSQWRNVKANLEGEVAYKAAIDDEEREALFDMYLDDLRERDSKEQKQRNTEAIAQFKQVLSALDLNLGTRWTDVEAKMLPSHMDKLSISPQDLPKIDMLLAFEEHMQTVERTHHAEKRQQKVRLRRQQSKTREAYVEMLKKMRAEGLIDVGTKWKTVHGLIKDRTEFLSMIGQEGSSPMDLFWDICEEIEQDLREKKSIAQDVLESKEEVVAADSDFSSFSNLMQSDNRTSQFSRLMLQAIFIQLVAKAQKRLDEKRRNEERRLRQKQDDLRSAMKKLDPPIRVDDTYANVRLRISMLAEFTALESEEAREAAFSRYIRRLKDRLEEDEERVSRRDRHSHRSPRGERRHHERERRSSRDSRRSIDKDGHESRRSHRSDRRPSISYDPRSPKRTKRESDANDPVEKAHGTAVEADIVTATTNGTHHENQVQDQEMTNGQAGDESEEGEIAE